jgi:uncharacterized caspase-like protein
VALRARLLRENQPHSPTLVNDEATPERIRAALERLTAMSPIDLGVVFFAGHGVKRAQDGDMRFVTGAARIEKNAQAIEPESALVGWSDIAGALGRAKGRVLVLLDACHAGHVTQELVVPNDALASALVRDQKAGVVVFAAAKGRQLSFEPSSSRPHGFFTGGVLSALSDPRADRDGDGSIQLSELLDEAALRVARATKGLQTPWVARRDLIGDFTVMRRP